jgi:hypothetical protein
MVCMWSHEQIQFFLGMKGRIQISQETADLLIEAGKIKWFYAREDKVVAKGKGEMNTFWLKTGHHRSHVGGKKNQKLIGEVSEQMTSSDYSESDDPMDSDTDDSDSDTETELLQELVSPKTARLIEFNTEVLIRLLKQIQRKRLATMSDGGLGAGDPAVILRPSPLCSSESSLASQMRNVITMPKFDPNSASASLDTAATDEVSLDKAVISELHDFVTNVAIMYKSDLEFHNFEHASHVVLSVTKFLSRMTVGVSDSVSHRYSDPATNKASELHEHTYGISSDPVGQFCCAFSALIHDIDHPGVPNEQLVKEKSELADAYHGQSIAEQNSLDLSWELLMDEQYSSLRAAIFETQAEMNRFRALAVNCVMATDLTDDKMRQERNLLWQSCFNESNTGKQDKADQKATLVLEYMVRASDVVHTMQHWHIYRKWNDCLFKELYRAYQEGRGDVDPSKYWYEREISVFDKSIIPIIEKLEQCGVFGVASKEAMNYAMRNQQEWVVRGKEIVQEMVAAANRPQLTSPMSPAPQTSSADKGFISPKAVVSQAKVASLMQQVQMLALEEERIRNETTAADDKA